ncbi:isoleucyl-tRNA synthetase [Fomitiporia mediterranea MF3/22]|uniref:isoleucyl-tRNA synthetase n=1 Tax=Fomitiporia mediterranea (strain MF3/22) TaxID=694068 RepID=UPI0004408D0B|nr:isoleucyl-tRNA synthetase [Fomitiporia mediterranea MF3/22]EJD05388.1 isoleucyl-tRNA synthetase [Fomitiporia mediterranea MF3/22]
MLICRACRRQFHSSALVRATDNSKAYAKTLRLPKSAFPQWCDPQKSELPFRSKISGSLYKWQEKFTDRPLFVFHDGPPYANGNLHMGHAMNKILKDMINRFQLLQGRRVNYIPGWDCHGLPIEAKTLKELKKEAHDLPAHIIRSAAKTVAEREIEVQKEEFQELGIMANWSKEGTYRTLDRSYELRQLRMFQKMVEKGLIYRQYRPVHYSPSSRSALAEAELEYRDDHVSRSVYVLFTLDSSTVSFNPLFAELLQTNRRPIKLMVWTTTPWTLTANMGIAVNQELRYSILETRSGESIIVAQDRILALQAILGDVKESLVVRGTDLVGLSYLPLFPDTPRSIAPFKVISAAHVTSDSGTGLVHCAPAHGAEDYSLFRAQNLLRAQGPGSLICHVDSEGRYNRAIIDAVGETVGQRLLGLDVLMRGTNLIIEMLKEMKGVLMSEERITHRYPYDWKTDKPIIVTATLQWFTSLKSIKEEALDALKNVIFHPAESRNRLESFVRSRSEWCISRQRVWGAPIPSLHHLPSGEAVLTQDSLAHILSVLEDKGPGYWWDGPVAEFIPSSMRKNRSVSSLNREWAKGSDTMDVWFDSGSSWSLLEEKGFRSASDGAPAYADVCLEGSDQHRGWFQSMLLTAIAASEKDGYTRILPYKSLVTHGMVLDQAGKKMSKSLGNVMSPMTIIRGGKDKKKEPAYGADVLRYWVASVEFWRDAPLGPTVLAQAVEALRKIRNTARFMLGNIGDLGNQGEIMCVGEQNMNIADRYVMRELFHLESSVLNHYKQLNFPRVVQAISRFANITLSALYFDITKDVLYAHRLDSTERRAVVYVLNQVLERLTLMLAPITPHLAEEINHYRNGARIEKSDWPSVFVKRWTPLSSDPSESKWDNDRVLADMDVLLKIRDTVLGLLEQARGQKDLRSSLEAEVDIIIPDYEWLDREGELARVLRQQRDFLKTLFIVSDVSIVDEGSLGASGDGWVYTSSFDASDTEESLGIRLRPATRAKCPRCWTYTRHDSDELCGRCSDAVQCTE